MKLLIPSSILLLVLELSWTASAAPTRTAAPQVPATIYTFDARPLNRLDLSSRTNAAKLWDSLHLLAAIQGLANRESPNFYLFYCSEFGVDTDQFWFDWLRGEDGWLSRASVKPLKDLGEVLNTFRHCFAGAVVYDPTVPATATLASTIAGCEDLLPMRFDASEGSIYQLVCKEAHVPVRKWLINSNGTSQFTGKGTIPDVGVASTGSAKADVYKWAIQHYLKQKRCSAGIAAYYIDSFWIDHPRRAGPTMHTLSNHDYFISKKAFFFDLSCWADEQPTDDLNQPPGLDASLFKEVMRSIYELDTNSLIKVGGFTPWPYKYTSHASPAGKHDGVPTEWEFARVISQYNGYMEADAAGLAGMANASCFQHYPLKPKYAQPNRKPVLSDWKEKGYVTKEGRVASRLYVGHYVGDYDAPSWLYKAVPAFFPDKARGKVPLGWAFNPNLSDRAPQALAHAYRHAGTNDYFIAGDSGAGYLNQRSLTIRPDSGLPSALELWKEHCRGHFARWDMTITGFILDGAGGGSALREYAAYASFSPDGSGTHFEKRPAVYAGMATCPERDLPDRAAEAAKVIAATAAQKKGSPGFLWARSILKKPEWYAEVSRLLKETPGAEEVVVVDPYTFFGLIKLHVAQANETRSE